MEQEIRISDKVRLNSGSTDLTVVAIEGDDLTVEWLNERDVVQRTKFNRICVSKVDCTSSGNDSTKEKAG
jgi:hypothetical protein